MATHELRDSIVYIGSLIVVVAILCASSVISYRKGEEKGLEVAEIRQPAPVPAPEITMDAVNYEVYHVHMDVEKWQITVAAKNQYTHLFHKIPVDQAKLRHEILLLLENYIDIERTEP